MIDFPTLLWQLTSIPMVLKPQSRDDLARMVAEVPPSKERIEAVDLGALCALVEHRPEDMTATVEAGMPLAHLQDLLRPAGQWLPVDPPKPQMVTISEMLARDLSGPRRLGYGTVRDYVIGMKIILASGEIIKTGGKVVKNVAGYDLAKVFIGAKHSLGVIVEATFKLRPVPEQELILQSRFDSIEALAQAARRVLASAAEPVLLDAHNLQGALTLVLGFAGVREDLEYQRNEVEEVAFWEMGDTSYDERRGGWSRVSVLPSETRRVLDRLAGVPFVARLGNGVVYHQTRESGPASQPNAVLAERIKSAYDPGGIFPEYSYDR